MVDIAQFREAMGHFASGVTVVTVSDGEGGVGGLTANAFSSLSLEPPLVLICVDNLSKAREYLDREQAFTVHFLGDHQEEVALAFARRGPDKADGVDWNLSARGTPVLADYLVALECQMENAMEGGDHMIIVGRVLDIRTAGTERPPLTYYRGQINALVPKDS
ncbi:MAG: flavin reductase family protein [Rhodospirillales bacterium]|nr:flavin reductase family protein [Rhodospirillales bacterium]